MNKSELVEKISLMTHHTRKDTEEIVDGLFDAIKEALAVGDRVQIARFGSFECRRRSERVARNLHTKEQIQVPAAIVPVFKAGKALRAMVDKPVQEQN